MEPDVTFADAVLAADAVHEHCNGGEHWYVGTASDPRDRLALVHNVDLERGDYFCVRCTSVGVALAAACLLRLERGYRSAPGAGGADCVFVYAYTITAKTREVE
jgi:hypothetical protein